MILGNPNIFAHSRRCTQCHRRTSHNASWAHRPQDRILRERTPHSREGCPSHTRGNIESYSCPQVCRSLWYKGHIEHPWLSPVDNLSWGHIFHSIELYSVDSLNRLECSPPYNPAFLRTCCTPASAHFHSRRPSSRRTFRSGAFPFPSTVCRLARMR